jgi:predicted PurR-regulated permease PerM
MEERSRLPLTVVLLLFAILCYVLLKPFLTYLLLGIILAFLTYPAYAWLAKRMRPAYAAGISTLVSVLLVIIPLTWLTRELLIQASDAYRLASEHGVTGSVVFDTLQSLTTFDVTASYNTALAAGQETIAKAIPTLITSTGNIVVGMILFFFVYYYALIEGKAWFAGASNALPFNKAVKHRLQSEIAAMTKGLFYGQVLTAVLIGIGCGLVFLLLGVDNAVLWGFLMMLLAFLPLLGAPFVYIPAGILVGLGGSWGLGILLIVLCTCIVVFVEYIVRPKFVSSTSAMHPLTVIIGALGGIYLLGFIGFLAGPLVIGIFLSLLRLEE